MIFNSTVNRISCAHTKSLLTQKFQSEAWDLICMYIIVHILVWAYLFRLTSFLITYLLCGLFLKRPYKRFCFFIFFIFISRDFSRTMVRRVWRFLLPADHIIGGLICHCPVAWSPWLYIFIIYL